MILSALLALTLGAADEPETVFSCWAPLGAVDGVREGRVYLDQDRQRRFLRHELSIHTDDFQGFWSMDSSRGSEPEPRPYAIFWLQIPEHTAGPVRVSVMADGRPFWSGSLPPNSTIRVVRGQSVTVPVVMLHGAPLGTFPSLWNRHRLDFSASDGQGVPIVRRTITLPDWGRIARRARVAVRAVDRLVSGANCLPATVD